MTTTTPTLLDTALALMVALGIGALAGGSELAGQSFFCASLAVANLAVFRFLVVRATAELAEGGSSFAATLLSGKLVATLVVVTLLLQFVEPIAIAIGLATVLGITAISGATHPSRAEAAA